jgi:hypothetical protein
MDDPQLWTSLVGGKLFIRNRWELPCVHELLQRHERLIVGSDKADVRHEERDLAATLLPR